MKDASTSFVQTHSRNEAAVITQYNGATPVQPQKFSLQARSWSSFFSRQRYFLKITAMLFSPSAGATGTFL